MLKKKHPSLRLLLAIPLTSLITLLTSCTPEASPKTTQTPPPGNTLWIGNSLSAPEGIPKTIDAIARAQNLPLPNYHRQTIGGSKFQTHIKKITEARQAGEKSIIDALPEGEQWDTFIIQGFSMSSSDASGTANPVNPFVNDAIELYHLVRKHSPNVRVILYETWARPPGHFKYPYAKRKSPELMQSQIHATYTAIAEKIRSEYHAEVEIAYVGEAMKRFGYDLSLYNSNYHLAKLKTEKHLKGDFFVGLVIFEALYNRSLKQTDPTHPEITNLLKELRLPASTWKELIPFTSTLP